MRRLVLVLATACATLLAAAPAQAADFSIALPRWSSADGQPPPVDGWGEVHLDVRRDDPSAAGSFTVRLPSALKPYGTLPSDPNLGASCEPWSLSGDEYVATCTIPASGPFSSAYWRIRVLPQRTGTWRATATITGDGDTNPANDAASIDVPVRESTRADPPLPAGTPTPPPGGTTPSPEAGRSEVVAPASGTVLVRRRGSQQWVRLTREVNVPDGSELDATRGVVELRVAADRNGATATAQAGGGRFVLDQDGAARPMTTLTLSMPLTGCGAAPRAAARPEAAARTRRGRRRGQRSRRLWVEDRGGRWRTRGSYASATVVGTKWTTADACRATTVRVALGTVRVRDLVRRRTVAVRAGGRYTARAAGR